MFGIGIDIRAQGRDAIFVMARTLADMIDEADSLTLTLVTGEIVSATDTRDIAAALVEAAVFTNNRAIACRLYNAYSTRMTSIGLRASFQDRYGEDYGD
jgi:hypothetical protein